MPLVPLSALWASSSSTTHSNFNRGMERIHEISTIFLDVLGRLGNDEGVCVCKISTWRKGKQTSHVSFIGVMSGTKDTTHTNEARQDQAQDKDKARQSTRQEAHKTRQGSRQGDSWEMDVVACQLTQRTPISHYLNKKVPLSKDTVVEVVARQVALLV